jgi:Chlorite dismutase
MREFTFVGGTQGPWRITGINPVTGDPLQLADRLEVVPGFAAARAGSRWSLRGITSNERYVTAGEKRDLAARQEGLGRPRAACAALIPIRKSAEWWALPQDARRAIFEEGSRHTAIGLEYLPAIARRLHHCRDLGSSEPFDFLTWFEFEAEHATRFEELVARLRASPEWRFVEREVDIRLVRAS